MNSIRSWSARFVVALVALPMAACLSPATAVPAVRVFDPRATTPGRTEAGPRLRVQAASHLGQEFVLRIAAHEVVLDTEHRWIEPPTALVEAALVHALGQAASLPPAEAPATAVQVDVQSFEFDLTAAPKARLRANVQNGGMGRRGPFAVEKPAASRAPEELTKAMAAALAALAVWVRGD